MIIIKNKRSNIEKLQKDYPDAVIIDVTSKGNEFKKLSPFYPLWGSDLKLDLSDSNQFRKRGGKIINTYNNR